MLDDFTFGQFFPVNSLIHSLDARLKILLTIAAIALIFCAKNFFSLVTVAVLIILVLAASKIPFKMYFKNLKFILPIIILTTLINLFYIKDGNILFEFKIIKITDYGVMRSVFMALRVILLILISSVLTYTTSPNDITDGLESIFSPLKYIGLGKPIHTMTMMMTIALRFIPTLIEEAQKIMNAQKARGADFENGNLVNKIKAVIPILIPLLISSVRRAYDLAEAMESRCYNGGVGRTRLKQFKLKLRDYITVAVTVSAFCAVFIINGIAAVIV